jgi:hypothetical protein
VLFALPIPDEDSNTATPGSQWQYALDFNGRRNGPELKLTHGTMPAKWNWALDAPVALTVPARAFDWKPTDEQPLPEAPVPGSESHTLRMVPYGCTKFRVSMFPVTPKAWQTK